MKNRNKSWFSTILRIHMNDEELIPSLDSGLEALIAEFNGFAAANQNSPAYGSPKAARDTAVMLRSCLVLSRKLKSLSTDEILGTDPQSSKYRTFDIVKFTKKMSGNRTEELKAILEDIEVILDGKLSITNWKIEAFGFQKDIVQGHGHHLSTYTRFPLIAVFRANVIRIGNNVESKNSYKWETSVCLVQTIFEVAVAVKAYNMPHIDIRRCFKCLYIIQKSQN